MNSEFKNEVILQMEVSSAKQWILTMLMTYDNGVAKIHDNFNAKITLHDNVNIFQHYTMKVVINIIISDQIVYVRNEYITNELLLLFEHLAC